MITALQRLWAPGRTRTILGAVLGAVGGALYAHYVGCVTGSCPITSNPYVATVVGGMMGALAFAPSERR